MRNGKNAKRSLAALLALIMTIGMIAVVPVFADETRIASIKIEPITLVEGTGGYIWETNDVPWFHYSIGYDNCIVVVEMMDGTTFCDTKSSIEDEVGLEINIDDDQDVNNQWGVGTRTVNFEAIDILTLDTFSGSFKFTIVETPVDSIEVEKLELLEGADGGWWNQYGTDGKYKSRYFDYNTFPDKITVTLKDGKVITGDPGEVRAGLAKALGYGGFYIETDDDQDYENRWGVGVHKATIRLLNVSAEYEVEIKENNVASFASAKAQIEIPAYTDGWYSGHYEGDKYIDNTWYFYQARPELFTVTEKDGTKFTGTEEELEKRYGGEISFFDSEAQDSYDGRWEEGQTYELAMGFMGRETSVKAKIGVTTVKSVRANNTSVAEYTNGRYDDGWDSNYDWVDHCWYRYSLLPETVTIVFKDGTKFTGTPDEIEDKFDSPIVAVDEQSFESQMTVGKYDVEAMFMGIKFNYEYEIKEDSGVPVTVTDVEYRDVEIGFDWRTFDDDGHSIYMYYPDFTVYFNDGTSVLSQDGGAGVNHKFVSATWEDGQPNPEWTPGRHLVKIEFEGFKGEFYVTVLKEGESVGSSTPGDVNGDGNLNAKDVTAIMKHLVGKTPKDFDDYAADYNRDGSVNAKDVFKLMKDIVAGAKK